MDIICECDGSVHSSVAALHQYLRFLHIKQESYYHQYHPRHDKLTGELIKYKDRDQYLSQEFSNKNNLKKWVKENPDKGMEWSIEWLKKRKEEKRLIYAPSQVELKTLMCPSMHYYDLAAVGYDGITNGLGFKPRYGNTALAFSTLTSAIIQDTREQNPLKIGHPTRVETLNVGDYALAAPQDVGIRVERKSLNDFCGTLSGRETKTKKGADSAIDRFRRELDRARAEGLYVIMMVESNINDAQSFNYLPQTKHVKASPSYIMHNMRALLVEYPLTFQAVFVDGRVEMANKLVRILQLGDQVKRVDLQYAYEKGDL